MALLKGGNTIIQSLGKLVGLLLSLYVFDQIIAVVLPLAYNCSAVTTTVTLTGIKNPSVWTANTTGGVCYQANSTATQTTAIPSMFGSSLTFIQALFPIMGIIGTFEIVYEALRQTGMV